MKESCCDCKAFIHINYQDLLDNIFSVLINNDSIQERKLFIIKEYIKALSINYSQKNNIIMAIEPTYQQLLIDFWNNNERLITLSLEALKSDSSLDSETRKAIEETSEGIKKIKSSKDTTSYKFGTQQCKRKTDIVSAILKYCIDDEKMLANDIQKKWKEFHDNIKKEKDIFDKKRLWTFSQHKDEKKNFHKISGTLSEKILIYDETSYNYAKVSAGETRLKQLNHDFKEVYISNKKYYYYTQWSWSDIDFVIKFYIDKIKGENGPDIEIIP